MERARLLKLLHAMAACDLIVVMRMRARVLRYRASASFLERTARSVTMTGSAAIDADVTLAREFGLAVAGRAFVDGYLDAEAAEHAVGSCRLVGDWRGNVTLRVTDLDLLIGGRPSPVLVVLDLAESLDSRERAAGLRFLRQRLKVLP